MKAVFILGAGASRHAGAPLMAGFTDETDRLYEIGDRGIQEAMDAFELVRGAQNHLRVIYANSYLDLDNIETFFSAVEMGRLIGKFPGLDVNRLAKLRDSLVTVIVKTLENSMPFPAVNGSINPHKVYGSFVNMIGNLRNNARPSGRPEVSILTFNYDIALDYALRYHRVPYDYWLSEKPDQSAISLLKLHGSINWGTCKECGSIVPFDWSRLHGNNVFPETKSVIFALGIL